MLRLQVLQSPIAFRFFWLFRPRFLPEDGCGAVGFRRTLVDDLPFMMQRHLHHIPDEYLASQAIGTSSKIFGWSVLSTVPLWSDLNSSYDTLKDSGTQECLRRSKIIQV